jgi:hypothetical protein
VVLHKNIVDKIKEFLFVNLHYFKGYIIDIFFFFNSCYLLDVAILCGKGPFLQITGYVWPIVDEVVLLV